MFMNIVMMAILIIAIIFFLGFIGQLIYLIVTPSKKLSTIDCIRKNILSLYFKNIKIYFEQTSKKSFFFILIPCVEFCVFNQYRYKEFNVSIGWLFWFISFEYRLTNKK